MGNNRNLLVLFVMDFAELGNNAIRVASSYAKVHPVVAGIAVVLVLFLFYRKPLVMLFLVALGLLLAGALYVILEMAGSGTSTKERMIRKDNVPESVFRASPIQLNSDKFDMSR